MVETVNRNHCQPLNYSFIQNPSVPPLVSFTFSCLEILKIILSRMSQEGRHCGRHSLIFHFLLGPSLFYGNLEFSAFRNIKLLWPNMQADWGGKKCWLQETHSYYYPWSENLSTTKVGEACLPWISVWYRQQMTCPQSLGGRLLSP